jgi:serine/threonine-protein kinase HipA
MMISNAPTTSRAFVWIWLPSATEPVVAGQLQQNGEQWQFNYGQSYLRRADAISIYELELPLRSGALPLLSGLSMPGCLRDALPDAWGRRVILNRMAVAPDMELSELTYGLESGSDRIGGLDFQHSATDYRPRHAEAASLDELMAAADRVEQGLPLRPDLDQALMHGTSLGGARPKVMIEAEDRKFIAKLSSSQDVFNVVKAEYVAMRLAQLAGLNVAPVRLTMALGRDVLLIERFDRVRQSNGWKRCMMVSALTMLALDEMMAAYASYQDLAEMIRRRFLTPRAELHELFGRIVFNILCGNTDDHARNHAAFWDGHHLSLTPAYDICPQNRTGQIASQAMWIREGERASQIRACLNAAPIFQLTQEDARNIVHRQVLVILDHWQAVCDDAGLSQVDRQFLLRRQFLNPFAFEGVDGLYPFE